MKKTSVNTKKISKQKITADKAGIADITDIADTIAKTTHKKYPKIVDKRRQ